MSQNKIDITQKSTWEKDLHRRNFDVRPCPDNNIRQKNATAANHVTFFSQKKNKASFSTVKNKGVIYPLSLFYMGYAHRNRSKSNKIIKFIIKLRPAGRLSDNEFYRFFIDSDGSLRRRRINMADNKLF